MSEKAIQVQPQVTADDSRKCHDLEEVVHVRTGQELISVLSISFVHKESFVPCMVMIIYSVWIC